MPVPSSDNSVSISKEHNAGIIGENLSKTCSLVIIAMLEMKYSNIEK